MYEELVILQRIGNGREFKVIDKNTGEEAGNIIFDEEIARYRLIPVGKISGERILPETVKTFMEAWSMFNYFYPLLKRKIG